MTPGGRSGDGPAAREWRNWSGSVTCRPRSIHFPRSEVDVRRVVESCGPGDTLGVAGAGHSFPPVVATDDVLVSLAEYRGLVSADADVGEATVRAGTTIRELNAALARHGLALENVGDIDRQTVAGALATGTHGTGTEFGVLAEQAVELRLVTADGEVRELTPADGDAFRAAQVSLGALGVVTAVTLDVDPAYRLREVERPVPLADLLPRIGDLGDDHSNVEFFWFPHTDTAVVKTLDRVDDGDDREPSSPEEPGGTTGGLLGHELEERVENAYWGAACRVGTRVPGLAPRLNRLTTRLIGESTRVGPSHEIYPSTRAVRFEETEYGVPAGEGIEAFRALADRLEREHPGTMFPVEFRFVAGDDIPLSPAYGRDSVFLAAHRYHRKPYRECLQACGEVLREHGGRPHWGKRHWLGAGTLRDLYPEWETFRDVRREFDPDGLFTNGHLREVLGEL